MSSPTAAAAAAILSGKKAPRSSLPVSPPRRSSRFRPTPVTRAAIPKSGIELFERVVKSQPTYYQDFGHPLVGTCIKQPVTGMEEHPATRVNPAIGIISGFLPKRSPCAQTSADGSTVDTLYAVFVDCNTDILQDDYTEVELEDKKVTKIPFSAAIKVAKANNYLKFQPSLPHPATIDFLNREFHEGYDDNGFLIEVEKPSKTKGKDSQGKAAKSKAKQTSMQKDKKQRQKKRKKQEQRGKTKAKKTKDAFNAIFDDDSSYAGKFVYSHLHTPFSLSLSLYLVFSFFIYIIY